MKRYSENCIKKTPFEIQIALIDKMVRLAGIGPAHLAPEASALSTELQAHTQNLTGKRKSVYHKGSCGASQNL